MCLIFWKEAWLRRAEAFEGVSSEVKDGNSPNAGEALTLPITETALCRAAKVENQANGQKEKVYRCQATELLKASQPMAWWDIRQYAREILSRNISIKDFVRISTMGIINFFHEKIRGWRRYPKMDAHLMAHNSANDSGDLKLQPGEYVQIKSGNEIFRTLNGKRRNRGLYFDKEMVKFCGRTVRVKKRVDKIIDDKSGRMIFMKNDCVILEGVVCCGEYSEKRLMCPRGISPFWRGIWLKRVPGMTEQENS